MSSILTLKNLGLATGYIGGLGLFHYLHSNQLSPDSLSKKIIPEKYQKTGTIALKWLGVLALSLATDKFSQLLHSKKILNSDNVIELYSFQIFTCLMILSSLISPKLAKDPNDKSKSEESLLLLVASCQIIKKSHWLSTPLCLSSIGFELLKKLFKK